MPPRHGLSVSELISTKPELSDCGALERITGWKYNQVAIKVLKVARDPAFVQSQYLPQTNRLADFNSDALPEALG